MTKPQLDIFFTFTRAVIDGPGDMCWASTYQMDFAKRIDTDDKSDSPCFKERLTLEIHESIAAPQSTTDRHELVSFE